MLAAVMSWPFPVCRKRSWPIDLDNFFNINTIRYGIEQPKRRDATVGEQLRRHGDARLAAAPARIAGTRKVGGMKFGNTPRTLL